MYKKKLCFDIDGVICKTIKKNYNSAKPIKKSIDLINELYKKNYIIIFTSRYMGRNNENQRKARSQGFNLTTKQLKNWKVKYHKLIMGKPSYDIIVDDKSLGFKRNWIKNLDKLIKNQLKNN